MNLSQAKEIMYQLLNTQEIKKKPESYRKPYTEGILDFFNQATKDSRDDTSIPQNQTEMPLESIKLGKPNIIIDKNK